MTDETKNSNDVSFFSSDMPSHQFFIQDPPNTLYHYTTTQGAYGIITSKELWLTKIQYLNDTTELRHAISLFRELIEIRKKSIRKDEVDFLERTLNQLNLWGSINIFVSSFCENGDLLSQWRAYGGRNTGVALGFSGYFLKNIPKMGPFRTWKCIYDPQVQKTIIEEAITTLLNKYNSEIKIHDFAKKARKFEIMIYNFYEMFINISTILKNDKFMEKKEWRIISSPQEFTHEDYNVILYSNNLRQIFKLRSNNVKNNKIIGISEVVIGPTDNKDTMSDAFLTLLRRNGYDRTQIKNSKIPYRYGI